MVINLSQHRLIETEHNVLSLGLNFAVAPKKATADNIRIKVSQALFDAKPPKPNSTNKEHTTIKDLRQNKTIHILQADKGNATVVMDKQDYDCKIQDLLDDAKTYSKI
ncbi:uncharacterized protein [Diadema antillarum]|uniref:uncharacterized protein n=1 Tax=Diadema antillarum TaxID=105358 RepID=UPI003A8401CE